jgi:soluble lytic murein transglycosylase-like protein
MMQGLELAAIAAVLAIVASRGLAEPAPPRTAERISVERAADIIDFWNQAEHAGGFDVRDVLAIVAIESAFDPAAHRDEPHIGDASRGLMQVLLSTARDRGFVGDPAWLYDPVVSVQIGLRQLAWSRRFLADRLGRSPTEAEWIGSYNAGVGNVLKGFIPLTYIAKWERARERYR